MSLKPIYVPLGEELQAFFANSSPPIDWVTLEGLSADKLADRRVVLLGSPIATEAEARRLVASGVGTPRVEMATPTEVSADAVREAIRGRFDLFSADYAALTSAAGGPDGFPVYKSGIGFLDKNLQWGWRLPELGIVAGPYASGKSLWMQQLAFAFAATNGYELGTGALICAWEDDAREMHRNLKLYAQAHSREWGSRPERWIDTIHYVRRHGDEDRLISWYIDLVTHHNAKYGTRFFTLDPWNEMDHKKDARVMETDYTRDMMKEFRRLVDRLKIILLIATHVPAKMIKGDGSIEPFRIAHSFGSSQFANKADRGMCIVRTKKFEKTQGHLVMHLDKSKVERLMGNKGTVSARWNSLDGWFEYDAHATEQVQDIWKD